MNEEARKREFYVVVTKDGERYLVDTYSAATAAFIVESQLGEVVDGVHTTQFKKIFLIGDPANAADQTPAIETPNSDPKAQDAIDGFADETEVVRETDARR